MFSIAFNYAGVGQQFSFIYAYVNVKNNKSKLLNFLHWLVKWHVPQPFRILAEKPPNPDDNPELYDPYWLADDPGSNNTGFYELQGVLTHQGRSSSSGHYVAWIKRKGKSSFLLQGV